nr:SpoIIIAH-like family protein [Dorea longicatena]
MKEQEGKIVKKIAKKNQIVIATLAVMIAAAGYMNYSGKLFPGKTKTQETNSELANKELLDISDEDTSVSSGDIKSQDGDTGSTDGNASSTDDGSVDGTPGEAVLANGMVSSVAAQAKVSREQVRSKNKETLQSIIDNKNLSDAEKENAVNQMVQMTEIAEKEAAAESLLAAKGFNDSVVSITDDQADVIVGASELSDANRAQIEDIVTRKTGVAAQNIVINPVNADSK